MGFTCTPQVIGLVRGEPKINKKTGARQKHRANGKAILGEGGKERHSASETLDRTRSHLNKYEGFDSGFACWDAMCFDAEKYRTLARGKDGVMHERRLKSDAVIGSAVIIKPPVDMCKDWDDAAYQKFYSDSWDALCSVEPRIFSNKNIRMKAEHYDEGIAKDARNFVRHLHIYSDSKDESGNYCGNYIDAKMFIKINASYPAFMRSRGWDLDDLDVTDWDRAKTDLEYRRERNQKRRKQGRSVNKYVQDKYAQKLAEVKEQGEQIEAIGDRLLQQAHDERTRAENDGNAIRRNARKKAQDLKTAAENDAEKIREDAKKAADEYQRQIFAAANAEAMRIRAEAERDAQEEIEQIKEAAKQERDQIIEDGRRRGQKLLEESQQIADEHLSSIEKLEKDALETLSPRSVFSIATNVLRSVIQYVGEDTMWGKAANLLLRGFDKWGKSDKTVELLTRGARGVPHHRLTTDRRTIAENQRYMDKAQKILDDEPTPTAPSEPEVS